MENDQRENIQVRDRGQTAKNWQVKPGHVGNWWGNGVQLFPREQRRQKVTQPNKQPLYASKIKLHPVDLNKRQQIIQIKEIEIIPNQSNLQRTNLHLHDELGQ